MFNQVNLKCQEHANPFDCPEKLIHHSAKFDEYGIIIHDGGSAFEIIKFCPWCGAKLPESKRDIWFEELEKLGINDPWEEEIPKKFKTDEWYKEPS